MHKQYADREDEGGGSRTPAPAVTDYDRVFEAEATQQYVMRLYIAGNSLRSRTAIANVRRICDEYLRGRCDLEVIDIYQDTGRTWADTIIAAPTLVKQLPLPRSRIVGDMTRTEKVLAGLGLIPRPG